LILRGDKENQDLRIAGRMAYPSVSVIIPAYNEAESIGAVVGGVRDLYPDFEIIVIDDGSIDRTAEAALAAGAKVYAHPYNVGNGAAVKSGIREAGGELLVLMDADGQHNPAEIGKLLAELPAYDMVVGARNHKGQASIGRALGNHIYSRFASYVAKFPIQDLTSGFRAIKADLAKSFLYLLPNTYSYPTTITLGVLRSGRTLKYVPIEVKPRKRGSSQIKLVKDGARFFMIIVRICTLYSPMRVFLPVSFSMFLLGLGWYLYTFFTEGRFTNMSALLFTTSIVIFMMSLVSEQISQMRFERRGGERARPVVSGATQPGPNGGQRNDDVVHPH
jgi:glycosyltransferase involved in cell wall biosynthesis